MTKMTKLRAIVKQGPKVVRDAIEVAKAAGKARVNEVLINPFRTTAIVAPVQPKRMLDLSLDRFRHEWNKRKPEPDAYRKELEYGHEFPR